VGWYGPLLRRSRIILAGYFIGFAATGLMGLSSSYQDLLVTAFVVGFSNTLYYIGLSTVLMEYTPSVLIGRVVSTRQVALAAARVISPLVFGTLAELSGIREAILIMAIVGAGATALTLWAHPSIRHFDESKQPARLGRPALAWVSGPIDPEFPELPQRVLNLGAIALAAIGWGGVALKHPIPALILLVVTLGVAAVGTILKRRGWLP
jgi:MFS family permease